ncbi:MAG: hypothetical protein GXN99_01175 [Candidatus Nanohaloarchaeota archaeon]|nr:hypothetical protein [Candidatus Nanohaloarchaeota archaeon]
MLKANEEMLKRKLVSSASSNNASSNVGSSAPTHATSNAVAQTNSAQTFSSSSYSSESNTYARSVQQTPPSSSKHYSPNSYSSQHTPSNTYDFFHQEGFASNSGEGEVINDLGSSSHSASRSGEAPRDVDYIDFSSNTDFSFGSSKESFNSENALSQHNAKGEVLNEILEELRMLRSQNDYILSILKRLEKKLGE